VDLAIGPKKLSKNLRRWRVRLARRARGRHRPGEDQPLRSELLSAEQMAQQGTVLAAQHKLGGSQQRHVLLARLDDNERVLLETSDLLASAIGRAPDDHAGRRVAARQLLRHRGADPHRAAAPAEGLQPELPRLSEGASAGPAARLRHRARDDRPRRRPHRSRIARALPRGVPEHRAADARRALGGCRSCCGLGVIENLRRIGARIAAARLDATIAAPGPTA
jgi:hypothetical protein